WAADYWDTTKRPKGVNFCPLPACVAEDDRIYYYASNLNADQSVNYAAGETLVGVRTSDGVGDVGIPLSYDMNQEAASNGITGVPGEFSQLAALGRYVVVFQPQVDALVIVNSQYVQAPAINGHVFCFDTV